MSKPTPGPWFVADINTDPECGVVGEIAICAETDRTPTRMCAPAVAIPFGDHSEGRAMALANARLIAAAPELLAALKAILNNHETAGAGASIFQCTTAQVDAARAAIAKAQGES